MLPRRPLATALLPLILVAVSPVPAEDAPDSEPPATPLFVGYDPSPAWPHGRRHPDAPPQLEQFAFMIGEFDCVDRIRNQDGSWNEFPAIWNASYFLNGHGIQDQYWAPTFATSNIRIYDSKRDVWMVTFFKKPGYGTGVWEGHREDGAMVMRQESTRPDGTTTVSRLTFHHIDDEGFDWVAESLVGDTTTATWRSSCERRR